MATDKNFTEYERSNAESLSSEKARVENVATITRASHEVRYIWIYQRDDPHRTTYQIPLEAILTWKKLEDVLRHITKLDGQLSLYGLDDNTVIVDWLWDHYLRGGAKFSFSICPVITVLVKTFDSTLKDWLTDNRDEGIIATIKCTLGTTIFALRQDIFDKLRHFHSSGKRPAFIDNLRLCVEGSLEQVANDRCVKHYIGRYARVLQLVTTNIEEPTENSQFWDFPQEHAKPKDFRLYRRPVLTTAHLPCHAGSPSQSEAEVHRSGFDLGNRRPNAIRPTIEFTISVNGIASPKPLSSGCTTSAIKAVSDDLQANLKYDPNHSEGCSCRGDRQSRTCGKGVKTFDGSTDTSANDHDGEDRKLTPITSGDPFLVSEHSVPSPTLRENDHGWECYMHAAEPEPGFHAVVHHPVAQGTEDEKLRTMDKQEDKLGKTSSSANSPLPFVAKEKVMPDLYSRFQHEMKPSGNHSELLGDANRCETLTSQDRNWKIVEKLAEKYGSIETILSELKKAVTTINALSANNSSEECKTSTDKTDRLSSFETFAPEDIGFASQATALRAMKTQNVMNPIRDDGEPSWETVKEQFERRINFKRQHMRDQAICDNKPVVDVSSPPLLRFKHLWIYPKTP
ncbi:hypothetical protein MMC19_007540 [Ptychographa xylographoides]|nr:hypothetical protein [Ptychographa xylographoides]